MADPKYANLPGIVSRAFLIIGNMPDTSHALLLGPRPAGRVRDVRPARVRSAPGARVRGGLDLGLGRSAPRVCQRGLWTLQGQERGRQGGRLLGQAQADKEQEGVSEEEFKDYCLLIT